MGVCLAAIVPVALLGTNIRPLTPRLQAIHLWQLRGNSQESALNLGRVMRRYKKGQPPFNAPFVTPFVMPEWWSDLPSDGIEEIVGLAIILCDIVPHAAEIERVFAGRRQHAWCDTAAPLQLRPIVYWPSHAPPNCHTAAILLQALATRSQASAATWTSTLCRWSPRSRCTTSSNWQGEHLLVLSCF